MPRVTAPLAVVVLVAALAVAGGPAPPPPRTPRRGPAYCGAGVAAGRIVG
jgi:hypothetical protein